MSMNIHCRCALSTRATAADGAAVYDWVGKTTGGPFYLLKIVVLFIQMQSLEVLLCLVWLQEGSPRDTVRLVILDEATSACDVR